MSPEQKRPSDLLGEIDNEPRPALLFRRSRHARERHKSVLVKIVAWRREARFVLALVRMTVQARTDISGLVPESRMRP